MPLVSHGRRAISGPQRQQLIQTYDAVIPQHVTESGWDDKYKYFSERRVKESHFVHQQARHDPLNKHHDWGRMVLTKIAKACYKSDINVEALFRRIDRDHAGDLDQPGLRRVLLGLVPGLSDTEVVAIFAFLDKDHNGSVTVREFCEALQGAARMPALQVEVAKQWRNPIHRTPRHPPAVYVERDNHDGPGAGTFEKFAAAESTAVFGRLSKFLSRKTSTKRRLPWQQRPSEDEGDDRYSFLCGGADSLRFSRASWRKGRWRGAHGDSDVPRSVHGGNDAAASSTRKGPRTPPGVPIALAVDKELRPGFLCSRDQIQSLGGGDAYNATSSSNASTCMAPVVASRLPPS